jgi:hypothetical protein
MTADALDAHAVTLNEYMGKGDLRICQILDDTPVFKRSDLWAPYLRQPNIDAGSTSAPQRRAPEQRAASDG